LFDPGAAALKYTVIQAHRTEYPDPITLQAGEPLSVGERYEGPEGWEDWYFCTTPRHAGGWVPRQRIERGADGQGRALADYCARELDVDAGEVLIGLEALNGWLWCHRPAQTPAEAGWVPMAHLGIAPD
jgi:hypothetical protein